MTKNPHISTKVIDIEAAFLEREITEPTFIQFPEGWSNSASFKKVKEINTVLS